MLIQGNSGLRAGRSLPAPGYRNAQIYPTWAGVIGTANAIPAVDTIYFYMFRLFAPCFITAFGLRVHTAGANSGVKAAIYADSPVSHRPLGAPLLVENTGYDTTTTGNKETDVTDTMFAAGYYWGAAKAKATLPSPTSVGGALTECDFGCIAGSDISALVNQGISMADAYANSMPTIAEAQSFTSVVTAGIPILYLKCTA